MVRQPKINSKEKFLMAAAEIPRARVCAFPTDKNIFKYFLFYIHSIYIRLNIYTSTSIKGISIARAREG